MKQVRLLGDQGHLLPEPDQVQLADVDPVQQQAAREGVIEPEDEGNNARLAGAALAAQRPPSCPRPPSG